MAPYKISTSSLSFSYDYGATWQSFILDKIEAPIIVNEIVYLDDGQINFIIYGKISQMKNIVISITFPEEKQDNQNFFSINILKKRLNILKSS